VSPDPDVLVAGGGPAGAITALRLRRLGFRVHLAERAATARPHIGEAVSVGFQRQLDFLGLGGLLAAAGLCQFARSEEAWAVPGFRPRPAPPGAATLDRRRFDAALLARAAAEGVTLSTGCRVTDLEATADGWRASLLGRDGARPTRAGYLVDAVGRTGLLPRRRRPMGARTLALYAYWRGNGTPTTPRIAAGRDHWVWGAPVDGCGYTVTAFIARSGLRARPGALAARYVTLLAETAILGDGCLELTSPVAVCDATAWLEAAPVEARAIKVGEAAAALDPISATGLQKALQTAGWAAAVVNTVLRRPAQTDAAHRFYRARLETSAAQHARWAAEVYDGAVQHAGLPFWRARRGQAADPPPAADPAPVVGDAFAVHPDLAFIETPCLVGDFVEVRTAVRRDPASEAVAYVDDVALAPLLREIRGGFSRDSFLTRLSPRLGTRRSLQVLSWLVAQGLVTPAPA
jgi:flavin-dependent dehydrogenase